MDLYDNGKVRVAAFLVDGLRSSLAPPNVFEVVADRAAADGLVFNFAMTQGIAPENVSPPIIIDHRKKPRRAR